MQNRTIIGIATVTLLSIGLAAAAYAFYGPSRTAIDLVVEGEGEAIAVGLEPILSEEGDSTELESGNLPQAITDAVITEHAQFIDAPADSIRIERSSRRTWSDGCLGLGGPAETCLSALTEGWQITVVDGTDNATTYRTNLNGDSIRREPQNGAPVPLEEASPLPIDG